MADIVLSPILQVIFDRLASPLLQTCGDTWDFEENLKNLYHALLMVQAVLEDAEAQQGKNKAVRTWLLKLKDAAYNAEDVLDKLTAHFKQSETKKPHLVSSFLNATKLLYADDVRKMLQKLETIAMEGFKFHLCNEAVMVNQQSSSRETGSFINESKIYGRDEDKKKMVRMLLFTGKNVSFISIFGIGGQGKTTLAQLAYNDEEVTRHFDVKVWAHVSIHFDVKRIMKAIIESATMEKCESFAMDVLQSKLWALLRKRKYLIVLDDVWTEDEEKWDNLEPVLQAGMDGSKVLITTRNEKVASIVSSPPLKYFLRGLTEDDCWKVFKDRAFRIGEADKYPNLLPIGREIIKKCGCLPLAAKHLGWSMRFKREERDWLFVQNTQLQNLDVGRTGILAALKLSYLHLPSHLKRCFAFCSIIPKGYDINKENLIRMWMAEGLIQSERASKPPEDIGEEYFQYLLWGSFLEEARGSDNVGRSRYRMHDLMHELAQSVTGEECIILEQGLPSSSLAQTRHSSVSCGFNSLRIPKALYEATHLRSLIFFTGVDISGDWPKICTSFPFLRVLDVNSCNFTFQFFRFYKDLLCLRYLNLSHTPITYLVLDSIDRLPFLQTLNLHGCCNLKELPVIANMVSLRHLNITGCEALTSMLPSSGIYLRSYRKDTRILEDMKLKYLPGPASQLQTLPTVVVHSFLDLMFLGRLNLRGELTIRNLENLSSLEDTKSANLILKDKLDSLGLYWRKKYEKSTLEPGEKALSLQTEQHPLSGLSQRLQSEAEEVIKGFQPHKNLRILTVKGYQGVRFPHWTLPNLTKVDLTDCDSCECLPVLGNLLVLKNLTLQKMPSVKFIGREFYGDETESPFPSLEELFLGDFPNLQQWFGVDGRDNFPRLSKLVIKNCPELTSMPLPPSLRHLELEDCKAVLFDSVRGSCSLAVLVIKRVPDLLSLSGEFFTNNPFLTSMEIVSCPMLRSLPLELGDLNALKSLRIHCCEELSSLSQGLRKLTSLELLEINDCDNIIHSLEDETEGFNHIRSLSVESCSHSTSSSMSLEHLHHVVST